MTEPESVRHNLPNLTTSFVGRQTEIADIARLLDAPTCQLLTLVGPGGVGKTRLALEVARQKRGQFAHGVWLVALAPLTAPDQIAAAIMQALQIQPIGASSVSQELFAFFRDKELLLVLDNFEHVLDGVTLVEGILQAALRVKILVTSRATLNIQAEWVQPVVGMRYPDHDTSENLEHFSAVSLFVERAQRVRPDFALDKARSSTVRICQLVEGIPLALELAAAWLKTIPCDTIADQIQGDLDFLATNQRDLPERHRSIRAVFDHSWHLLTPDEQRVFRRFSVFRGGCTLAAAEGVTGASLPMVAALIEKSLLTLDASGRYSLHELLRQYGEEKLKASDEVEAMRDAHSTYFCGLLEQCEADIKGGRQVEALNALEPDVENIRAAWLWASDQRNFSAIQQAFVGLNYLFATGNRLTEQDVLRGYAYQRLAPLGDEPPHRVWIRLMAQPPSEGNVDYTDQNRVRCEQALELAHQYGDEAEIGICLHWLGEVLNGLGAHQEAISYLEAGLKLLRATGNVHLAGRMLNELGRCYIFMGEPRQAIPYNQEAFNLRRELNDRIGMAWCQYDLGDAHLHMGQVDEAERHWLQALRYFGEVRSFFGLSTIYASLINLFLFSGSLEQAQRWESEHLEVCNTYHGDLRTFIRVHLAVLAALTGDYERSRSWCQSASEFPGYRVLAHLSLAIAAWGVAEFDHARSHFLEMLDGYDISDVHRHYYDVSDVHLHYLPLLCLPLAAVLLAGEGERAWAAELLALVSVHPAHLTGWMKRWPPFAELHDPLETHLGVQAFSAAWERGEKLNLDSALAALRSHFLKDTSAQRQANQALPDPLTERELEVLNLIYAGSSNREIAAYFVIAESTIKRHINHMYGKLAVENRAEAITRARELGLLR